MNRAVFDTLAAARALREAEFGERQAEAIASVVCRSVGTDRGEFATKADLKAGVAVFEARSRTVCLPPYSPLSRPTPPCFAAAVAILELFLGFFAVSFSTLPRSARPADSVGCPGHPIHEAGQLAESDLPPFVLHPQTAISRAERYSA